MGVSLEETPEGVVMRSSTSDLAWMSRVLAGLSFPFVVRGPSELREALRRLAAEIVSLAGRTEPTEDEQRLRSKAVMGRGCSSRLTLRLALYSGSCIVNDPPSLSEPSALSFQLVPFLALKAGLLIACTHGLNSPIAIRC